MQGGPDGSFGVIFVGDRHAKKTHDRLTHVLVNRAVLVSDSPIEPPPQHIHHVEDVGVGQRLSHRGKAGDVGKKDGDLFALGGFGCLVIGGGLIDQGQFFLQSSNGRVNHGVAQRKPLLFQRSDSLL